MFEYYQDKSNKKQRWRWRLKNKNGIVAISEEAFSSKKSVRRSIEAVQRLRGLNFYVYVDKKYKIRWRLTSKNGRTLAISPCGYDRTDKMRLIIREFEKLAKKALPVEVES